MTCALGVGHACTSACAYCGMCCSCPQPERWSVLVYNAQRKPYPDWELTDDLTEREALREFVAAKANGQSCVLRDGPSLIQAWTGPDLRNR